MRASLLLLAAMLLASAASGTELGPLDVSAKGYAELRSAYYSRGAIVDTGPVQPFWGQAAGSLGRFGSIGGSAYAVSALTSGHQTADRRRAFNEVELRAFYGYDWKFTEDLVLANTVEYRCSMFPGYRTNPPARHEWCFGQELKNPYLAPFYLWRHAFEGAKWNYWRVGLARAFPLGGGFVFKPKFWCDMGDSRLFAKQCGAPCTDGLLAVNGELRLEWWFAENLGLHAAVQQFDVVSHSGRDSLESSVLAQATTDLTIFTIGLSARF